MAEVQFTLYGHSYCSLCEKMLQQLAPLQKELGFSLSWVDIEGDQVLEQRFGEFVPVLMKGDEPVCQYHLDEAALQQHFNRT